MFTPIDSAQKALAYDVLHDYLREYRPGELPLLSSFWDAYHAEGSFSTQPTLGGGLGVQDEAQAAGLTPVVAVVVWSVVNELVQKSLLPTAASASKAVVAAALALSVPQALAEQLAAQLAPRIVEAFRPFELKPDLLVVQWIEHPNDAGSGWQRPDLKVMSDAQVTERFRTQAGVFTLFVDEPARQIRTKDCEENLWPLPRQQRLFLLTVLEALQRGVVSYEHIDAVVFDDEPDVGNYRGTARARVKGELDKRLGGFLDAALKAERGEDRYAITAPVTHCWVRSSTDASRLLGEP